MNNDFRVYVLSLPRCGSSMMTGICEYLGVHMKYTTEEEEEVKKREQNEKQRYGETYRMNPRFYEITKNNFKLWMDIYNNPFSGCKVIIPVSGFRWEAMIAKPAKVIMMWRDPSEIRQSQEASYKKARADYGGRNLERRNAYIKTTTKMLQNIKPDIDELDAENMAIDGFDEYFEMLKPKDQESWEIAEAFLRTHLAETQVMLENRAKQYIDELESAEGPLIEPFEFKIVKYRDVLNDTEAKITEIAEWINADPARIPDAIASVNPNLIRFKSEELIKGI